MAAINLIYLKNEFILSQLHLEEALLRCDNQNWCLINQGSPPAIVMGISSKQEDLLNLTLIEEKPIPVIRRFSGGGTVVVDHNTFFVTFIINQKDVNVALQPEAIMHWSSLLYKDVFPNFSLRENDYVFLDKKFGGNAQYLRKDRFLHHTSFLWDMDPSKMLYLQNPKKAPKYRSERSHLDFLCTLKEHFLSQDDLQEKIAKTLGGHFDIAETTKEDAEEILKIPHRRGTVLL